MSHNGRFRSTLTEILFLPIMAISICAMMIVACILGGASLAWEMATSRPLRWTR